MLIPCWLNPLGYLLFCFLISTADFLSCVIKYSQTIMSQAFCILPQNSNKSDQPNLGKFEIKDCSVLLKIFSELLCLKIN